ncbi:Dihydroorotase [Tsukamurella strandjordii]|uniref:dihydroorotase n=1 Tax=Tsukamurella strandjordii TaxID=147577 RepID=UPI0039EFC9E7
MSLLLTSVRPYGEGDPVDVAIDGGEITAIGAGLPVPEGAEVIDGAGAVLLPGFVDLHTHLREPGREDTETIESGSAAAALGGYTAVFAMANTSPVADSAVITDHVYRRGREVGLVDVHPVGAVTVGLKGEKLAEMGMMAARLGLTGWPRAAEEAIVARDALLARDAGARVHICHASTAGTVELLKWAKEQGVSITAEVTPHHLLLDDSRLATYDAVNRVNPPLREASDVAALRKALRDGVIDCVATDHAPHADQDKCCEFAAARPGMLGLETALAIVAQVAVEPGDITWRDVARVMSEKPAEIARLDDHGRPIEVGEPANLTLVDPDLGWTVHADDLASRSRNTPFADLDFRAKPVLTVLRGRITARDGVAAAPGTGERA